MNRNRPDTTIEINNVFPPAQRRHFRNHVIEFFRRRGICLGEHACWKTKAQATDLFLKAIASREKLVSVAPNHIAPLLVDVLNDSGNKRKLPAERTRECHALREFTMPCYQSNAKFMARETVAKIQIAQLTAVVSLVVGRDSQLEQFGLQITRNLIHRPRMHRTG